MLRNVLVILAVFGLAVPRLGLPCCAKAVMAQQGGGAETIRDQASAAVTESAHDCCCSGCEMPPPAPEKTDHSSHSTPQSGGCTGCGLICCVKVAVPPSDGPVELAPMPAEHLTSGTESAPPTGVSRGIFRPPRS